MNNSILIAPLNDVQGLNSYPEFVSAMNEAYTMGVNLAKSRWGQDGPALVPGPNQFGICTPRKNDMANDVTDNTPSGSYRWTRSATATGWADLFRFTSRKDMIHAFVGFLFSNDVFRILQLRMELGSRLFPVWDLAAAKRYDKFAVIFRTDEMGSLVVDQSSRVLIRGYWETIGQVEVVPLGFELYRRSDMVNQET